MKNHTLKFYFLFFLVCPALRLWGQEPSMPIVIGGTRICPGKFRQIEAGRAVAQASRDGKVTIQWESRSVRNFRYETHCVGGRTDTCTGIFFPTDGYPLDTYNNNLIYIRYRVYYRDTGIVKYSPYLEITVLPGPPELIVGSVHQTCSNAGSGGITLKAPANLQASKNVLLLIKDMPDTEISSSELNAGYFKNLPHGSYDIQITDSERKCYRETKLIGVGVERDDASVRAGFIRQPSCFNKSDGVISLLLGGYYLVGFEYSITGRDGPFQSSRRFANLPAGSYTPCIKDWNGCIKQAATVNLINPTPVNFVGTVRGEHPMCLPRSSHFGYYGRISLIPNSEGNIASGGAGDYQYSIGRIGIQSIAYSRVDLVLPGTYTIIKVEDRKGCMDSVSSSVTIHSPITATTTITPATCSASNDGTIQITASGGSGNFQYSKDGINYQFSNVLTGFAGGAYYSVFVKDSEGCVATINCGVWLKNPIRVHVAQTSQIFCQGASDGSLQASPSGGSGAYSRFSWTKTSGTPQTITGQGTQTISGLKA